MQQIRYMEASNNAMGLTEQFNSDLTTREGTDSNNIDVHMMRSTEYGAIAILAVSGYGNPVAMQASGVKTTTGNVTGVYYTTTGYGDNAHYEWVAGGLSGEIFSGTNSRYYDAYSTTNGAVKVGDAMNLKWQGASKAVWITQGGPYFCRNYYGYFGFYGDPTGGPYFSRGVAVCGRGLLYRTKLFQVLNQKGKFQGIFRVFSI